MRQKVKQEISLLQCRSSMGVAAACGLGAVCAMTAVAQAVSTRPGYTSDVALTYAAQHSLKAATNQGFWMQGGAVELGVPVVHRLEAALNVTGSHADSIGSSSIPLSLLTFTVGPRYRFPVGRKVSVYGEGLFGVARGFESQFPSSGQLQPYTRASSFAMQLGGGVDYPIHDSFSVRALDIAYVRIQLPNGTNNVQNIFHVGAGVVFRFGSTR